MKHFKWMSRAGRTVLAAALSLAMAIPSVPFSAVSAAAEETKLYYGDVNKNGKVEANDALAVLKHVVKLQLITDETAKTLADMDGKDGINATDALSILKTVVGLEALREYAEATPTAEPTEDLTPTLPPAPEKTEVPVDPANAVTGEPVTMRSLNGATYDEESGVYTYLDEASGIYAANPFSGHTELSEVAADLLELTTAAPDHDLVWDLPGASKVATGDYPVDPDPRVTNFYAPEAGYQDEKGEFEPAEKGVTYTRPEWTKGVSFSFWAKSQDSDSNDAAPILTMYNSVFVFSIRLNGSVYFECNAKTEDIDRDAKNILDLQNTKSVYNEWAYYTVTIKNDWVQVYVNGESVLYTKVNMNRKEMGTFNDGFLTRYNADGDCAIDLLSDYEHYYYYTAIKGSDGRSPYYLNPDTNTWMTHDNYTIFGNSRYRGTHSGGTLLMDCLISDVTYLVIGGVDPDEVDDEEGNMTHLAQYGTQVSDVEYYLSELTAEQVAANYAVAEAPADIAVPTAGPTSTPSSVEPTPTPTARPTVEPDVPVTGAPLELSTKSSALDYNGRDTTSIDETTGLITYNNPVYDSLGLTAGVVYANPAAQNANVVSSMNDALEGQYLMPDAPMSDNATPTEWNCLRAADGTVLTDASGNPRIAKAGNRYSAQSWRNNYKDVYYGELDEYGAYIDDSENTVQRFDINNPDPDLQVTTFARPVWKTGMSYSFWYKPTADESYETPVLTLYLKNSYVFYMDVKGSVFFSSLKSEDWANNGMVFTDSTSAPYNCFAAVGDEENVNRGEWNYYTVTFANDMITVYINGEEAVYKKLNLAKTYCKQFNGRFLTRYNPIGLRFVGEDDDPRQYLTKSGYLQEAPYTTQADFKAAGEKERSDEISIRMNNVYEDLNEKLAYNTTSSAVNSEFGNLMLDLFATKAGYVILGGFNEAPLKWDYVKDTVDEETGDITYGWSLSSFDKSVKWCTDHTTPAGAEAYNPIFYDVELTAGNVKANYEQAKTEDAAVLGLQ